MMDICMIGTILVSCILMKLFVTGAIPRWSRRQRNKTCRRIKGMQHESFTKRQFSRQGVSGMVILGVIIAGLAAYLVYAWLILRDCRAEDMRRNN